MGNSDKELYSWDTDDSATSVSRFPSIEEDSGIPFYNPVGSLVIGAHDVNEGSEHAQTLKGFDALVEKFPFFDKSSAAVDGHRIGGELISRLDGDGGWRLP